MARRSYSKEFKARVALDALKGQKTVGEIVVEVSAGYISPENIIFNHVLFRRSDFLSAQNITGSATQKARV